MLKNTFPALDRVLLPIVLLFYGKAKGAEPAKVLGSVLFMQKIIGFNRMIGWPCHFTSKVIDKNKIVVGHRSFPGWSPGCYIQAKNGLIVGDNLRTGPGVKIISANHDACDYDKWVESGPIIIGDNVWLGAGSVVMPGVKIGDNVIIGANSVVTKSIPSDSVAVGIPCKVVKVKDSYEGKK